MEGDDDLVALLPITLSSATSLSFISTLSPRCLSAFLEGDRRVTYLLVFTNVPSTLVVFMWSPIKEGPNLVL
jgi:hypothetical protein